VNGYVVRLRPATLFFAVAYIAGIALVMRGGPARRVCVMAHAVLYVAMTLLTHTLMIVIGMATGLVVAPTFFAFAFLRRLSTLEATISLPARPFPAFCAMRSVAPAAPAPERREPATAGTRH
jgi:hypothetical protein